MDSWEYLGNSPELLEPQFADYDIEVMMVFTLAPGSINKSKKESKKKEPKNKKH